MLSEMQTHVTNFTLQSYDVPKFKQTFKATYDSFINFHWIIYLLISIFYYL